MTYTKTLAFIFASLFLIQFSFAQKKQLDHSVYDDWKSLSNVSVSDNGEFVATIIKPQEGDSKLFIKNLNKNRHFEHNRVSKYKLSPKGDYTVALLKAPFADTRQARIDKKKKNEMPKDSLLIINNETFEFYILPNVESYKTPQVLANYVAYITIVTANTLAKDSSNGDKTFDSSKNEKSDKETKVVVLHKLFTQQSDTLQNIKEYRFSKYGNAFAAIIEADKKNGAKTSVLHADLNNYTKKIISNEKAEYKSLRFDDAGNQLVYLATKDTSKVEQKMFDVLYFTNKADSAIILADTESANLPDNWIFNDNSKPFFSKSGNRIIIGSAPRQTPKDTTIVDFEMATLDIWHWQDPYLPPKNLINLSRELNRNYRGVIELDKNNKFTLIASEEKPYTNISDEYDGRYALIYTDIPYRLENNWDYTKYDAWVYDIEQGKTTLIGTELAGRPSMSPNGKYAYWFDVDKGHWFVHDNNMAKTINVTQDIPANFWNEQNDRPRKSRAYGSPGWGEKDDYMLAYDAYDIWKIDPTNKEKPVNITQHIGRNDSITLRYLETDSEKRFIDSKETLLLDAFDNVTKKRGFYSYNPKQKRNPIKQLILDTYTFSTVKKSKNSNVIAFQKSNFNTSPDLYITNNKWKSAEKLTDINPQMKDYKWGTPELYTWNSYAGKRTQGILYKPENFDENKKYPLIMYFYEKKTQDLYKYHAPEPDRSTINLPFYSSRDYIVFVPDIHYTTGQPGMDAYNSIVAAGESLGKHKWVDEENMAIQGQSWGGYQVAYIITQTDMFKAAGAGAPVANMTSAYGGIRWSSGNNRQIQYEQEQSRLGVTLDESLQTYIDNSPLFFARNINTPLLIMHNDKDGAVPWYQGIELFMTMRRLHKPVWMLQYNDEEHNLTLRSNKKDLNIRLQQFFDHYLKGAPAPVWMTDGVPSTMKGKDWGYDLNTKQ